MLKQIKVVFPSATEIQFLGKTCTIELFGNVVEYKNLVWLNGLLQPKDIVMRVTGLDGDYIEITCSGCAVEWV